VPRISSLGFEEDFDFFFLRTRREGKEGKGCQLEELLPFLPFLYT